jgi:hypothetical protein
MEAVDAYFNGQAFVPTRPVRARTNQRAIVTILDDETIGIVSERSSCNAVAQARGILKGSKFTVDRFMESKAAEKELEDGR